MHKLSLRILFALIAGIIVGLLLKFFPTPFIDKYFVHGFFEVGGQIFIEAMKMLVVPIVFVTLVCGTCSLDDKKKLGRFGLKAIVLYIATTAIAITIGLIVASIFHVGGSSPVSQASLAATKLHLTAPGNDFALKKFLIHLIPANPIKAFTQGNMLQIIVFALLIGLSISLTGKKAEPVAKLFESANEVLMKLIYLIMLLAPIGVFCLIANVFAKLGFPVIKELLGYFFTVILVLIIQCLGVYSALLITLARLNPLRFFRKLYSLMIFAFSTSSSSASIPVTLETVEKKLGVSNSIAAFTVPLGATINMDGTAIMQGIATVFIANFYHIHLDMMQFLTVILTATVASIGTAGVPGVGLIMLAMVLKQVGLPVEGIGLIIGVDRLLDMLRTAVNVTGDSMIACVIARSEKAFSDKVFKA